MKNLKSNLPLLLFSVLILIFAISLGSKRDSDEISYSKFRRIAFTQTASVDKAFIEDNGNKITLLMNDGRKKIAKLPKDLTGQNDLAKELDKAGIETAVRDSKTGDIFLLLLNFGPLLLLLPLIFFMMRGLQAGGGQAFNFIKSKAKLLGEQKTKVTFADVAGVDEAKEELVEIVEFLKDGDKFRALGAKIPKGVLLVGPPGTGKTLLAKAIAGEADVPFYTISGSDFVEMFVGVGASRVRDLFEQARKKAPCIVFVDEIDAVGRQRGAGFGGHDEREQTLNQLLVEMDGFDSSNTNIIIIAATNRPDVLDKALTRPGRFDRQVTVDFPDMKGREAILKVHSKDKKISSQVELKTVSKRTPGFTGADLANAMNEAALIAARKNKKEIESQDLEEAIDKVFLGSKKMIKYPFRTMQMVAYHEVGHALINILSERDEKAAKKRPLHKVTIVPRGRAGGVTWSVNDEDYVYSTKNSLIWDIRISLGGMAAEEIVYGDTGIGVSSDLQNATKIAKFMITQVGMSDLGPIAFGEFKESFLGDLGYSRDYSEEMAKQIDERVTSTINRLFDEVKTILTSNRTIMDAIVLALLDKETLDRDEVERIMKEVEENTFDFEEAKEKVRLLKEKLDNKDNVVKINVA
ncbi:MAG: ATP-dependent zinc metalloprotease FtsH [Candidatus Caenarcaniphilales bacterium]|nr:ATP-dependent zinc metalloprotease FtsH [Candidatus Caenarcaniphilales bacterium]